jgi:hypothetical protein
MKGGHRRCFAMLGVYDDASQTAASTKGSKWANGKDSGESEGEAADEEAAATRVVVKTLLKPMDESLKQLVLLTSGTSSGSAKVMSTHW